MTIESKDIFESDLTAALRALKLDIFRSLYCVMIGTIQSFDGTKKTAKITIVFKRVLPDGTITTYPALVDCPVVTIQGGGGAIQMPVASGDQCLVLFADRNIDAWFKTGGESAPFDARCHDLSDGVALVGVNALSSPLPAYDDNVNIVVPSGKKLVISGGATIDALGTQMLALKADVDNLLTFVNLLITTFNAHVHTGVTTGSGSSGAPATPFSGTPPTIVGTTKLLGS